MDEMRVRDLMVPMDEYATVSQDATLYDAIVALEEAQNRYQRNMYLHRAVLAVDPAGHPVGKVTLWVVLRALEPKYAQVGDCHALERFGFTGDFIRSIMDSQGMWQESLDTMCARAAKIKVADVMYTPGEGEYVDLDAPLAQGIHQLVMGHHRSLLVTHGTEVVGVLRLIDVFWEISRRIKASRT